MKLFNILMVSMILFLASSMVANALDPGDELYPNDYLYPGNDIYDNLILYYNGTHAGATIYDISSAGNDGTTTNIDYAPLDNNRYQSIIYDGTAYITAPALDLADESYSLSCWINTTTTIPASDENLFMQGDGGAHTTLCIKIAGNALMFAHFSDDDLAYFFPDGGADIVNSWHKLTATYNATTKNMSLYVDGERAASRTATANYAGTGNLILGRLSYAGIQYYSGSMLLPAVYDTDLNPDQERSIYQAEEYRINATPATYTISASQASVTEANTTILLTVTKGGFTDYNTTVDIATVSGSASSPDDYTTISDTLSFTPNDTIQTVALSIKENSRTTSPKTFTVALSSPTGNATLGTPYSITITINPNAKDLMGAKNNMPKILGIFGLMFIVPIIIAAFIIITMLYTREVNPIILVGAVIGIGLFFIVLVVMLVLAGDIMTIVNP